LEHQGSQNEGDNPKSDGRVVLLSVIFSNAQWPVPNYSTLNGDRGAHVYV